MAYVKWPPINAHADIYSGARSLSFGQHLLLYPHCVNVSSDCFSESVHVQINVHNRGQIDGQAKNYRAPQYPFFNLFLFIFLFILINIGTSRLPD